MLSRRSFFRRIVAEPAAYRLLVNSLAVGEADSALDLDRIAEHVRDPRLSAKIYRHYAEECRHGRLFVRRAGELGFEPEPLPPELDYEQWAQRYGMGTPKARVDDPEPFSTDDLILFFAGSVAGEERACAEMRGLLEPLADDPETVELLQAILADETRHVSYATEELARLAAAGHRRAVLRTLRGARRAEAKAHRRVSRAFSRKLMETLGAPFPLRWIATLIIDGDFLVRWLFPGGLGVPALAGAMPIPARPAGATEESP